MANITKRLIGPNTCAWESCPPEIMYKIFSYLDAKNLLTCMLVKKKWYCIVSAIVRLAGWGKIVELGFIDKGASFIKKSRLDWQGIIINFCLWQSIKSAKISYNHKYKGDNINKINIYRGNMIIISASKVIYFDMEKCCLVKTINYSCIDYDENDYMIAVSTIDNNNFKLTLCHKPHPSSEWQEEYTKNFNAYLYKMIHSECYIISSGNSLSFVSWVDEAWSQKFVARYYGYGTISDLVVYYDEIYAVLDWGRMLKVDKCGLKFILGFTHNIPRTNVTMYNIFGVIVKDKPSKRLKFLRQDLDHWILKCPNLSCVLVHGQVLLLGYKNGKVQVFLPNNAKKGTLKPELSFNIQKFIQPPLKDPTILALDVSEASGSHHLCVATCSNILQIMFVYPKALKKFMQETCV